MAALDQAPSNGGAHLAGVQQADHVRAHMNKCDAGRGQTPYRRASGGWLNACRPIPARPAAVAGVSYQARLMDSLAPWAIGVNLLLARTPRMLDRPSWFFAPRGSLMTSTLPSGLDQR